MAKSLLSKATFVAGGITTTAGLATVAYLSTRTTVGDKLQDLGLTLISDPDDYKVVLFNDKGKDHLKTSITKATSIDENDIKAWCEKETKEWFSSDTDKTFLNAKTWCVVPTIRTLRDKLKGNLHESGQWQTKFKEFAQDGDENKFLAALNHGVTTGSLDKNSEKGGGDKLKEWCNSALELKIYENDTHKTEVNVTTWCLSAKQ